MKTYRQGWIVDTDAGVDDALALLFLLDQPEVHLAGITCVAGNCSVDQVALNVLLTLEAAGKQVPVYRGAEQPLVREPLQATELMGADGFGGASLVLPAPSASVKDETAALALLSLTRQAHITSGCTLLALGPLTNLALALALDRQFVTQVDRLVMMGGSIAGRGNASAAAEFNIFSDPEAAFAVFNAGFPEVWLLPWETSLPHLLPWEQYDQLAGQETALSNFFHFVTRQLAETLHARFHLPGMPLPDLLAAGVALEPAWAHDAPLVPVEIDYSPGPGYGLSAVHWFPQPGQKANARVVQSVDSQSIFKSLELALNRIAERR